MARNANQCPLFSSGKVLFSVSFNFGSQTKKLFSVSCYIGIKITPQLPHSCHTVTPQLTFLCALPQQVPYKHPTSNPTSYPTSWQVRSRRAFWLFTNARWSTSAARVSTSSTFWKASRWRSAWLTECIRDSLLLAALAYNVGYGKVERKDSAFHRAKKKNGVSALVYSIV